MSLAEHLLSEVSICLLSVFRAPSQALRLTKDFLEDAERGELLRISAEHAVSRYAGAEVFEGSTVRNPPMSLVGVWCFAGFEDLLDFFCPTKGSSCLKSP